MVLAQAFAWAAPFAPARWERGSASTLDAPWPAGEPIRLCLIRVDFQPDDLTGTTGDGSFGSGFPDTLRIDPLPHDKAYFEDHLAFLEHYYSTVSNNAISFSRRDIFPASDNAAYRLAYPMWHYNFNSDTALLNLRLVELFVEAVTLADPDADFTQYDAVLVVHAGVGKDFNVGFDNTPFDIPSAYISPNDLNRFPGGVPAGVTRGLLLPEAQNQPEVLELGVELSLNGVMIKLFGNWLGMPDLFNTETGASGIGRWGMMDQGSGNVNAMVPALPDAWSRLYMGWDSAEAVELSGTGDTLRLARFGHTSAPRIAKIAVTDREYYLLENRDADADSLLHVKLFDRGGREMRIERDGDMAIEPGFRVPVRASHYDFGLPGSGLLLWKIDEDVIADKIAENRVNADPANRGVDLVEGDGSQDIGREYGFATAGSGTELGIQDDCWYRDNRSFREANGGSVNVRFNDNTRPSARLTDHSFTFLEISDFTDVDSIMSCRVRGTLVEDGFPVSVADTAARWAIADLDGDGQREFYAQSHDTLFVVDDSSGLSLVMVVPDGVLLDTAYSIGANDAERLCFIGNPVGTVGWTEGGLDSTFRDVPISTSVMNRVFHVTTQSGGERMLFTGESWPRVPPSPTTGYAIFDSAMTLIAARAFDEALAIRHFTNYHTYPTPSILAWMQDKIVRFDVADTLVTRWITELGVQEVSPIVVQENARTVVFVDTFGYLDGETGEVLCDYADVDNGHTNGDGCMPPQVDWDGDGRMDGGGPDGADNTPREDFTALQDGMTTAHDLNFDSSPDLLQVRVEKYADGTTRGGRVAAYDHETHVYPDFPLAINGQTELVRLADGVNRRHLLMHERYSDGTMFSLMRLPVSADGAANEIYQAPDNIIIIGAARPQVHERDNFVYVWPNPATSLANIRLTLPFAARADVKIFDLAGRKVADLAGSSSFAGAFEIPWNTTSVQSGVYIGRVDAHGAGENRSAEIKIAVVR